MSRSRLSAIIADNGKRAGGKNRRQRGEKEGASQGRSDEVHFRQEKASRVHFAQEAQARLPARSPGAPRLCRLR